MAAAAGVVAAMLDARLEISERRRELIPQLLQARDLVADFGELVREDAAHALHRILRRRLRRQELVDLMEREPEVLELADPVHPIDRFVAVHAEAAGRSGARDEQAELLVTAQCALGFP